MDVPDEEVQHDFPAHATGVGSLFAIHLPGKAPIQDAKSFANSDRELTRKLFSHLLDRDPNGHTRNAPWSDQSRALRHKH